MLIILSFYMAEIAHYLMKEFGLNSFWKAEDKEEVMSLNKELWEGFRREYFEEHKEEIKVRLLNEERHLASLRPSSFPNEYIPGFIEFIDDYHNTHGYSLVDVGILFGLSRQRIGQIFDRHGLERHEEDGAMSVTWSDEENRFVSITREDYEMILRGTMEKQRERKLEERHESERQRHESERQRHIKAIRDFKEEYGRVPTIREIAENLGYSLSKNNSGIGILARIWGYDHRNKKNNITYSEAMDNLYRTAGMEERHFNGSVMKSLV